MAAEREVPAFSQQLQQESFLSKNRPTIVASLTITNSTSLDLIAQVIFYFIFKKRLFFSCFLQQGAQIGQTPNLKHNRFVFVKTLNSKCLTVHLAKTVLIYFFSSLQFIK